MHDMISTTTISTPLGNILIGATGEGICLFDFEDRRNMNRIMNRIEKMSGKKFVEGEHPYLKRTETQISEYFSGYRTVFDLPLHFLGTPFQKQVWQGLLQIPYGETRSYLQQSILLGNEKAIRAVAGANGENGIAIIVPCHRVVGTNGSLTGYGGGLQRKQWLLQLEQKHSLHQKQGNLFPFV
jgi:AraC family transcriptional regulator of adaptative response/methylated-DNA-[protein]-cysteine methyltransferase